MVTKVAGSQQPHRRRVGLVGGAGQIGWDLARRLDGYCFVLLDLEDRFTDEQRAHCECVGIDITRPESLRGKFEGLEALVHLAGARSPLIPWDTALDVNIQGTFNVMTEAVRSGCPRVLYASSVEAVRGYPASVQVRPTDRPIPGNLYGVSKAAGEAIVAHFASAGHFEAVSLRVGAYQPPEALQHPQNEWMMDIFCAPEDLASLVQVLLDAPDVGNIIVNAVSNNRHQKLSIEAGVQMGYRPTFDSYAMKAD